MVRMETGGEGVAKVVSVSEAVRQIHSGDTVAISGSGGCVCEPTGILKALGVRYLEEQQPRDLTILHAGGLGDKDTGGTDAIAYEGLVKRDIGGHWAMAPRMAELALEEKVDRFDYEFQKRCVENRDFEGLEMYVMELLMGLR